MQELNANQRLKEIVDIMLKMTQVDNSETLLDELVEGASALTNDTKIDVKLLNHVTGELEVHKSNILGAKYTKLQPYSGISGLALRQEKPIRVDNILDPKWQKNYIKHWEDTRSEIVLPLVVDEVKVRVECEVKTGSKVIGVLNIESPHKNAFSKEVEEQLWLLARHAAIMYDRREYDRKFADLRQIEQEIADENNYEKIMQIIVHSLTRTLDFKLANISLIEGNYIKSKYLAGMPEYRQKQFKKMAIHSLSSKDIQADIVRKKTIEVPGIDDPRFDQEIFGEFDHKNLIRLFLPMIDLSSNKVIGTVEVGYPRQYTKYIYEQDIQIVLKFVNYAVRALERKKSDLIDRITHEFRSPIVGIRSHASFLERRFEQLSTDLIKKKLNDMITDCEILLYQVGELDYFLRGADRQKLRIEKTFIFRDIIIKIIKQLKPVLLEYGFSPNSIKYPENCSRISIFTDKAKINQVVYNLLINSIKYADYNPQEFQIKLEVEDKPNQLSIKFKDWGIGIKFENRDKIFEEGFRSQEAIEKDVTGSGLGLTIAKAIMIQLGGDLKLTHPYKPTEFQITLPKKINRS